MSKIYCCKLSAMTILIGCVFFVIQTLVLAATFYILAMDMKEDNLVKGVFDWFASEAEETGDLEAKEGFLQLKKAVLRVRHNHGLQ
jgi:hypothetical protein